ncbi:MAG: hydrogenase maturation nickel metallochaperone HypA [Candidatus Aenigmarchaeota archaeon]|nr:hydrogenase maturation nickel metallochaperone HypA [Candidatus Aenigmarchaeota archaeon]
MPSKQGKKIPKDDVLEFVVRDILRQRSVDTQKELAELANRRFAASGSSFRVSPARARLAALGIGAKIVIRTRKGEAPKRCPGCGHRLAKTFMRNLKGRDAVYAMRCPRCGYEGRLGHWLPSRYGFGRL